MIWMRLLAFFVFSQMSTDLSRSYIVNGAAVFSPNVMCNSTINSCSDKMRCLSHHESENGEIPPKCYCDEFCSTLNDCCLDYASSCNVSKGLSTNIKHHALQPSNWRCFQYNTAPRSPGIWMIASCPVGFKDNETRRHCEKFSNVSATAQTDNFLGNIPVSHSSKSINFRNIYCARCNGANVFDINLWYVKWRCNVRPPEYLNTDEKTKFLLENCPDYRLKPHKTYKRRYCFPVVSTCSVQSDYSITNDCLKGPVGLVYDSKTDQHYKNPSCLRCNTRELADASCGPSEFSSQVFQPKSFEMVLQFQSLPGMIRSVTDIKRMCAGMHQIYDESLEECRIGFVPDPLQSIVDTFRIKAWLNPFVKVTKLEHVKGDILIVAIATKVGVSTRALRVVSSEIDEKVVAVTFDVQAISANSSDANANVSTLGLRKLLDFKDPFNVSIDNQLWSVFRVTHRRLTCSNPKIFPPSNFTSNGSHVIINNNTIMTNDTRHVHFIKQNHTKYGVIAGSLFVCTSFYGTACEQGQVLLALQSRDYLLQNGTLLFVAANTRYEASQFELHGNNAWICTNYTNVTSVNPTWVSKFDDSRVLWYFTVIGLSLSITCLLLLLVTYFMFKELRTIPGKNLMSLAISLILCHFTWLLGSGDTDKPVFCKAIAVVLHYLFLVSFSCTTVIAYDTRRAFPKNSADMSNITFPGASMKRFIVYLLFSWGVPFVFVVTCFVIDQQDQVTIGYGNAVICWLTDMQAQIIFFGVPIGVLLLYNLVAFIFTVRAIRAAKLVSKQLNRQGANRSNEIKIYFRLMTIMGFTWFFGFGAHALHKFLMYPFVVLTSLHGVYLTFAFAFKPYVFNLYRNKLANLNFQSRKSTLSTVDLTISVKSLPSKETESVM